MSTAVPCCRARLFPHYIFEAVPAQDVQEALRLVFTRWGKPQALRVDNGPPWGDKQGLPSPLVLWLSGLDIEVIHNRPYCPQDNGKVERAHGVVKGWIEPNTCTDFKTLQVRLNQAATLQHRLYPSCSHHRTRLETYPELAQPRRSYDAETEIETWHFSRALRRLAQHRWPRKVSQTGQISLYNRNYSVGRPYAEQIVIVRLDASSLEWIVENRQGEVIRRHLWRGFDAQAVRTLQMTYRKPCRRKSAQGA